MKSSRLSDALNYMLIIVKAGNLIILFGKCFNIGLKTMENGK